MSNVFDGPTLIITLSDKFLTVLFVECFEKALDVVGNIQVD